MTQSLPAWAQDLLETLELGAANINITALGHLADTTTQQPGEHTELLVGFIAGYAAGMAEGSGMATFERAHEASLRHMKKHLNQE